mmetsp:Transcript_20957/g.18290  ORF Transcript_20957/g.18290 Transcript_20957/m.18290 type:complete len:167 (+) Transcript_20957:31-531(+)
MLLKKNILNAYKYFPKTKTPYPYYQKSTLVSQVSILNRFNGVEPDYLLKADSHLKRHYNEITQQLDGDMRDIHILGGLTSLALPTLMAGPMNIFWVGLGTIISSTVMLQLKPKETLPAKDPKPSSLGTISRMMFNVGAVSLSAMMFSQFGFAALFQVFAVEMFVMS